MNNLIIAIDPGLNYTGVCVLSYEDNKFKIIEFKEIKTNLVDPIEIRLFHIYNQVKNLLGKYPSINKLGLEESFVNINNKSSLKLAMVSGVLLMLAGEFKLIVKTMSATYVKKKLTGQGLAKKSYIKLFVDNIFPDLAIQNISDHIYDAIGIGIISIE